MENNELEEIKLKSLKTIILSALENDKESIWYTETWKFVKQLNNVNPSFDNEKELKDLFEQMAEQQHKINLENKGEPIDEEKEIVAKFLKDKQKGTYYLAEYLTKKYDIITVGEKEREVFVYQGGYYQRAENLIIYPEIQRVLGHHTTKQAKGECFSKICDMTHKNRDVFTQTDVRYIPVKNGVYDMNTKTLLPHDSKYRFKFQFPIYYDPKEECPKSCDFLSQVLTDEQRATVEEWMGYYFYRYYMFKKAIIFVGEGDTGKTTLLELISYMIGPENISSVPLQKMTTDKFAAAHLYEKHGNIVDELSEKDVTDTGNFKIATGGGTITGEYKFGNQFAFQNFSKFTFACNQIPDVTNFSDEAYFNRWMVIRFEKVIEKKIPNFIKTLTTEEERSGLFNLAMRGLERLLLNEKFTYASTAIDTKLEMMQNGSSIARFVKECIYQESGGEVTNEDMYATYSTFCEDNELKCETITALSQKLPFYANYVTRAKISGVFNHKYQQVRGFRNVALKLTAEQIAEKEDVDNWMEETSKVIKDHAEILIKAS